MIFSEITLEPHLFSHELPGIKLLEGSCQNDKILKYQRHQLFPRRVDQERIRPLDTDQPLPQAQRPDEGAAGRQKSSEDRCPHRLWQK